MTDWEANLICQDAILTDGEANLICQDAMLLSFSIILSQNPLL